MNKIVESVSVEDKISNKNAITILYSGGEDDIVNSIECMDDNIDYKPYITAVLYDLKNKRVNVGADIGIGKGFIDIDDVKFID